MPEITQYAKADLHNAVLAWFSSHGFEVHVTHYQFDNGFYAWRHHGDKQILTLWVSQITAEDYAPSTIIAILRDLEPQAMMTKLRHAHVHVASNDTEFGFYVRDAFSPSAT